MIIFEGRFVLELPTFRAMLATARPSCLLLVAESRLLDNRAYCKKRQFIICENRYVLLFVVLFLE